ncbi:MAG: hypothetical protein IPI67_17535 [Myxococcales bacterium]|nr:hypothetical protein [Myxococcales bacterium]
MRRFSVLAVFGWGMVSLAACGGKTEGGTGGAGAQAGSGGSGAGGSGAQGGVGAGGSGAVAGGGMGGVGNTGNAGGVGAFGGAGGMGAVAGGGFGGTSVGGAGGSSSSIDAKAQKVCAVISTLPCAQPDCKKQLSEAVDIAQSMGCVGELEKVLDCALSYPLNCQGGEPGLAPPCKNISEAFQNCIGNNPGCSGWASSDGSCGLSCGYYDVTCKPVGGGYITCTCDSGPNAGKFFKLQNNCNSPSFEDAVSNVCG